MPILKVNDERFDLEEHGFLRDFNSWNERFAAAVASLDGVDELTEEHWKVINHLREYYGEHKMPPMIRKLCEATGYELKYIYELFPSGPAKGACKVAGLPFPTECV